MKNVFAMLMLLGLCAAVSAQNKIAVVVQGELDRELVTGAQEEMLDALKKYERYVTVNNHENGLFAEQWSQTNEGSNVARGQAVQTRSMDAAQFVCVIKVTCKKGECQIAGKILNVRSSVGAKESGIIYAMQDDLTMMKMGGLMEKLAAKMFK